MGLLMLVKDAGHDGDDGEDDEYHDGDYACWERGKWEKDITAERPLQGDESV